MIKPSVAAVADVKLFSFPDLLRTSPTAAASMLQACLATPELIHKNAAVAAAVIATLREQGGKLLLRDLEVRRIPVKTTEASARGTREQSERTSFLKILLAAGAHLPRKTQEALDAMLSDRALRNNATKVLTYLPVKMWPEYAERLRAQEVSCDRIALHMVRAWRAGPTAGHEAKIDTLLDFLGATNTSFPALDKAIDVQCLQQVQHFYPRRAESLNAKDLQTPRGALLQKLVTEIAVTTALRGVWGTRDADTPLAELMSRPVALPQGWSQRPLREALDAVIASDPCLAGPLARAVVDIGVFRPAHEAVSVQSALTWALRQDAPYQFDSATSQAAGERSPIFLRGHLDLSPEHRRACLDTLQLLLTCGMNRTPDLARLYDGAIAYGAARNDDPSQKKVEIDLPFVLALAGHDIPLHRPQRAESALERAVRPEAGVVQANAAEELAALNQLIKGLVAKATAGSLGVTSAVPQGADAMADVNRVSITKTKRSTKALPA